MSEGHHDIHRVAAGTIAGRPMRYYDFALVAFVVIEILSNLIGAAKLSVVDGHVFGAGILFFPIGYVLGDILTEVYGYGRARRCVWVGFAAMLFMAFMSAVVVAMPAFSGWGCAASEDPAFATVLAAHDSRSEEHTSELQSH